ncbi:PREDICTED: coiled-coil domain-containing protein 60 isoform X3 [Gavialis gangeticus]|uniref:coiled-coil domain-containing protein 60 isoform X3 n=1 Tax=Gavialis gangeticus TaxID=94835 RepID=UPI00092F49CC|nr:PREDICTED: coiled-coil domain-containing protein 60 isoform X3 [Gavialis gangeticus]
MNSRGRMPGNMKTLDPRYFVLIKPLPSPTQKGVKVRARSSTVYRRWEPKQEDVFWENYHRRHQQLTRQGYWTPSWKPYQELGEMLYLEPKKLTLYYLGQLPQEPTKEDVYVPQEEMTTTKDSPKPKSAPQESLKKPAPFKQLEKNLRTLSKDLTHTRHLINSVKQGRGYFYLLHKESLERKNALKAAQEEQQARWATECQPPRYSSDEEHSDEERNDFFLTDGPLLRKAVKKKMKTVVRPFTPVHNSLLVPNTSEAAMDPGGSKSTLKKINKEKTARYRWEHFIVDTKKSSQKAPRIQLSRKTNKRTSVISISRLSGPSSSHSRTPPGSTPSLVPSSEDYANVNTAPSDGTREFEDSESMQSKQTREDEEPVNYYLQKLLQIIHEDVAKQFDAEDLSKKTRLQSAQPAYQRNERVSVSGLKDQENITFLEQRHKSSLHGAQKDDKVNTTADQDGITAGDQRPRSSLSVTVREDKTTTATFKEEESTKHIKRTKSRHASYFIESKCNLHAEMRQKFSAIAEEAALCLHDNLEILERRREEKCSQKYQALKSIKCFERDLERMRQSGTRAEREHDEDECNWFLSLISRLPNAVKNDSRTQKILKKLEKFGKNPDLRIRPSTFLKVLSDLRVWELCSPDISAAVESHQEKPWWQMALVANTTPWEKPWPQGPLLSPQFVRENIVQIQEEVYKGWLQTQVKIPKRMQSAPPFY